MTNRRVLMRLVTLVAALPALTAVAAHGAAPLPKLDLRAVALAPPTFSRLPSGWRSFTTWGDLTPRGGQTSALATSWPYRLNTVDGPGGSIPANAILITVSLIRHNPGTQSGNLCRQTPRLTGYAPVGVLPLRLPATTTATLDGTPWPEYRVFGRLGNSYNFEVRVDISSRHPSTGLLRRARSAVAAIKLPRWPTPATC
jgi:hypothetical protein